MKNKILITGSNGFTAKALITELKKIEDNTLFFSDIQKKSGQSNYFQCNLSSFEDTANLIRKILPNQVYHLAGTFTNIYNHDYDSNVITTKNILESLVKIDTQIRVLLIGSAAEYGNAQMEKISETTLLNPISIYGLTKSFQTALMNYYYNNYRLNVVMARPFNLYGKGASTNLFIGNLFYQISKFNLGKIKKIILGDLSGERDYLDIKDAVNDYIIIMKKGLNNEIYNVGSGKVTIIKDLVSKVFHDELISLDVLQENNYSSSSIKKSIADISKILKLKKDFAA